MDAITPFIDDLQKRLIGYNHIFDNWPQQDLKYPLVNLYKTSDGNYHLELAVAGFSKDDLEVERIDNQLVIRGKMQKEEIDKNVRYLRRNISKRSFVKHFPVDNQYKNIDVELKDGILYIDLEKDESIAEKKLLEIK